MFVAVESVLVTTYFLKRQTPPNDPLVWEYNLKEAETIQKLAEIQNKQVSLMEALADEVLMLRSKVRVLEEEVVFGRKIAQIQSEWLSQFKHEQGVRITYYTPRRAEGGPKTAMSTMIRPGHTVAVSRELVRKGWMGKSVYIPGIGVRYVEDKMAASVKGKKMDVAISREEYDTNRPENFTTTVILLE